MDIKRARNLKVGSVVHCPPDRGEAGYAGKVTAIFPTQCVNIHGHAYIWVEVQRPWGARKTVWPSNRLG